MSCCETGSTEQAVAVQGLSVSVNCPPKSQRLYVLDVYTSSGTLVISD